MLAVFPSTGVPMTSLDEYRFEVTEEQMAALEKGRKITIVPPQGKSHRTGIVVEAVCGQHTRRVAILKSRQINSFEWEVELGDYR